MRLDHVIALAALTLCFGVTACATPPAVTAECRYFEPPTITIHGRDRVSQRWIDGTIEAGVAGCNWPRPKARP